MIWGGEIFKIIYLASNDRNMPEEIKSVLQRGREFGE
jgi:hypothetical protein